MNKLRVGIVGTGFIGGRHLDAISRIPDAQVVAVADPFAEKAMELAAPLGARVYATVQEMMDSEALDVVHNCTPTSLHYAINEAVITANKHLYCEKPLSLNASEGAKLVELLQKHPVANGINLNYRMNALIQDMHERVASGELGRCFMVSGSYLQDWMLRQDDYDWRLSPQRGGASRAVSDIGSHLFDASQYVLGKRIVAVSAQLVTAYQTRFQHEKLGKTFSKEKGRLIQEVKVENEDAANIMVKFSDGSDGFLQVSQISGGHKNDMRLRFDFEGCSCEWRQEENNLLYIGNRDEPNQIKQRERAALMPEAAEFTNLPAGHPEGWNDAQYQAITAFYRSITGNTYTQQTVPYATVADGAWIMKIIEACLISNACRGWIDVETGAQL